MNADEVRREWARRSGEYSPDYYAHYGPDETSESVRSIVDRHLEPTDAVLELGCSSGRHLAHLAEHGYEDLAGIEVNDDAFDVMATAYPGLADAGTFYRDSIEAVVDSIPDDHFDAVYSVETLQHIHPDASWVFPELVRITDDLLVTIENEGDATDPTLGSEITDSTPESDTTDQTPESDTTGPTPGSDATDPARGAGATGPAHRPDATGPNGGSDPIDQNGGSDVVDAPAGAEPPTAGAEPSPPIAGDAPDGSPDGVDRDRDVTYVGEGLPLYYRDWGRVFTEQGLVEVPVGPAERSTVHDCDTVRAFRVEP